MRMKLNDLEELIAAIHQLAVVDFVAGSTAARAVRFICRKFGEFTIHLFL